MNTRYGLRWEWYAMNGAVHVIGLYELYLVQILRGLDRDAPRTGVMGRFAAVTRDELTNMERERIYREAVASGLVSELLRADMDGYYVAVLPVTKDRVAHLCAS